MLRLTVLLWVEIIFDQQYRFFRDVSVEMSINENFLIAGDGWGILRTAYVHYAITYVLTGIEIGLLALPQIEMWSQSAVGSIWLITERIRNKRHVYVKPGSWFTFCVNISTLKIFTFVGKNISRGSIIFDQLFFLA